MNKNKQNLKRNKQTKSIAALVSEVSKPLLKKKQVEVMRLLLEWPNIVGSEYSQNSAPEKIFFNTNNGGRGNGVLTLAINERYAFEYQHLTPVIIERVNQFFGFKAIERIILKKSSTINTSPPTFSPPAQPPSKEWIASIEETIRDLPTDLKDTLRQIGIHLKR